MQWEKQVQCFLQEKHGCSLYLVQITWVPNKCLSSVSPCKVKTLGWLPLMGSVSSVSL